MSLPACRGSDPAVLRMQMSLTEEGPTNASTDSKMMAPWSIDYELAAGLEEPASEARAWKALLPGDARTRLVALARALGVKGEVYEQGTDHVAVGSPSAGKGSTEAASASVTMWVGGGPGAWSYYPPTATSLSGEVVEPCAAGAPDAPGCARSSIATTAPPPIPEPKNLPSEATALRTASQILGKAGYDTDSLAMTVAASTWSTFVSFEEKVDGLRTGNGGGIDFGEDATVLGAWGQFADYRGADTYPLIDLGDAVKRMSSGVRGSWSSAAPGAMFKDGASSTRTDSAPSPETPVSPDASPGTAVSGDPTTTIAPTPVVRITGVELALQNFPVSQDEMYLVPSYRFTAGEGEIGVVYAIPDKYLAVAEPPIAPEPVAPAPDQPAPVGPGSSGSSGASPGSGSTGQTNPGDAPVSEAGQISDKEAASLVGLTETEATKVATSKGWTVRVVERDGEQFMVTADWRGDRVNLTVRGGKVTDTSVG